MMCKEGGIETVVAAAVAELCRKTTEKSEPDPSFNVYDYLYYSTATSSESSTTSL